MRDRGSLWVARKIAKTRQENVSFWLAHRVNLLCALGSLRRAKLTHSLRDRRESTGNCANRIVLRPSKTAHSAAKRSATMMTADGAPPAADIEVPTANPLQPNAETTYVSLVPGIPADANSVFSIRNGYDDVNPESAKKIHRLSTRVLQLAVVNAVVIVTIRVVYIAFWAMDGRDLLVAEYSVYIFFSLVILYLGVQGVRKKNPPCCGGCGCGYLTTFYAIYIVFAAVSALTVLISLIFLVAPRRPLTL